MVERPDDPLSLLALPVFSALVGEAITVCKLVIVVLLTTVVYPITTKDPLVLEKIDGVGVVESAVEDASVVDVEELASDE